MLCEKAKHNRALFAVTQIYSALSYAHDQSKRVK